MSTPATVSYGADQAGLICGYWFDPQVGARTIGADQAAAALAAFAADDAADLANANPFAWLHFDLSHTAAEPWLRRHAGLDDSFFDALQDSLHSTRIERAKQSLIAVINDVHFDFDFEPSDIATLWISVDRTLVVTARRRPLRSIDHLRKAVKRGDPFSSTAELLEHLLRAQADVLVEIVRSVTLRIDQIEDKLLSGRLDHKRVRLGELRRLLVRLQRLLAPEPAALFRLLQHPPLWLIEIQVQALRQATEEFSAVVRDMSTLQERIKLLQEEIAASVNEANGRSLFVLTIVTVLALPINIIAGLFGMNVGGVPLADNPHGFWVVVAIVASFTAIAAAAAFRNRDR
jgi:zinc transporter